MVRIFFLITILFFSYNVHSQAVNSKFLLGVWEFNLGQPATTVKFADDSTMIQSSVFSKPEISYYKLDSPINNSSVIVQRSTDPDSITTIYWKATALDQDKLQMQMTRIIHFDTETKQWIDFAVPPDKLILVFKRKRES